ncbi:MAG: hypothetical protein IPJ26_12155 [Bacteroidetes bacterium]|nr:hypothetical protein [Bacteroidota bacterium]
MHLTLRTWWKHNVFDGFCAKVNSDGTSAWAATTSSGYPVWFAFGTDNNDMLQVEPLRDGVQCLLSLLAMRPSIYQSQTSQVPLQIGEWTGIPNIIRYTLYYKGRLILLGQK